MGFKIRKTLFDKVAWEGGGSKLPEDPTLAMPLSDKVIGNIDSGKLCYFSQKLFAPVVCRSTGNITTQLVEKFDLFFRFTLLVRPFSHRYPSLVESSHLFKSIPSPKLFQNFFARIIYFLVTFFPKFSDFLVTRLLRSYMCYACND